MLTGDVCDDWMCLDGLRGYDEASPVDIGFPSSLLSMPPMGADPTGISRSAQLCHQLHNKQQNLHSRVQKLERSRGQITKDIAEMLKEAQAMEELLPNKKEKDSASSNKARSFPIARTETSGARPSSAEKVSMQGGSVMPPPGLGWEPSPKARSSATGEAQLTVRDEQVGGRIVHKVSWRIDRVETKLRDCLGRPLVSQPFEVKDTVDLPELRLMVIPSLGANPSGQSLTTKEQKARYEALIKGRSLTGHLKLKVANRVTDARLMIRFNLSVGSQVKQNIIHDFADRIIHGFEFSESSWLEELGNDGSLTVGVDILGVNEDCPGPPPGLSIP
jgi:hypothetical protein